MNRIIASLCLLSLLGVAANADNQANKVAQLVHEKGDLQALLAQALQQTDPLVRATAARVANVREVKTLLPALKDALAVEKDGTAAREELRAIVMLGDDADVDLAITTAAKWPASMEDALVASVSRRGSSAIPIYIGKLRPLPNPVSSRFFKHAFWGHSGLIPSTASRILGHADDRGWRALLTALKDSAIALNPDVLSASFESKSEPIRADSVWYVADGYAFQPSAIPPRVREALAVEHALSSDREDFGRELLLRMLGGERKDDPRWLRWIESREADALLRQNKQVLEYLTNREYTIAHNRCGMQPVACDLPAQLPTHQIRSTPIAPPPFLLPEVLPSGLASAVVDGMRCRGEWLGIATVSVDPAGRVQSVNARQVRTAPGCEKTIATLLKLSLANNTSIMSPLSGPILLVRSSGDLPCLDEPPPGPAAADAVDKGETSIADFADNGTVVVSGDVTAPVVTHRVEPQFPRGVIHMMGPNHFVTIVMEAVISKQGCIRSINVTEQSPYPELNGAALMALSQWRFKPGTLNDVPVDVVFHLTVRFAVP
jgi:TonB family protein